MKLRRTAVPILCLAFAFGSAHAEGQGGTAQNQTQSVVAVNFNALVLETNEAQRDLGALETKFAPRQAQVQALNTEVEGLRKQLADSGATLSDEERATRTQALEAKERQLERLAEDLRSDSQAEGTGGVSEGG